MRTFIHYLFTFSFVAIAFTVNANNLFDEKNFLKIDTVETPVITSSHGSYVNACEGDIITLTASEAPDGYGYQWYKGVGSYEPIADATEQTLQVTQAYSDDFVVQYTGTCPSGFSNPITIFIQDVPTPSVVETADGNLQVGNGGDIALNSYTWRLDGQPFTIYSCDGIGYDQWCIQPQEEGSYTVCVYYLNIGCTGCSAPFTYELPDSIDAPIVTSSHGSYINGCEGDTITLTASEAPDGYGYQWYKGVPDDYQPIAGATGQTLFVTQAYTEEFVVKYTGTAPSDFSNPILIFLQAVPTPLIVETPEGYLEVNGAAAYGYDNPYTWYLEGESVGLESCPGIGYDQWCVQPTESGNYIVCTFYNNIGCSACSAPFAFTKTIDAPIITSSHELGACEGDTITLTASEAPVGYGYQWYDAFTDEPIPDATMQTLSFTQVQVQPYYVKYVGECPSEESTWATVHIEAVPTPVIFETTGGNLEVQGAAAFYYDNPYTWYLNGEIVGLESCPGIGYDQWCVQPVESGTYVVCTTYFFDVTCSACSESFNYTYTDTENITGVDDIQISPIPANDILTINLTTNKQLNLNLKLQNVHGQILMQKQQNISGNWNTSFNINHLPSGTYFLTLQSGNEIMTRKVLMN